MKKYLLLLLLLPGCANSVTYSYYSDNSEYINQGTKIMYVPKDSYFSSKEDDVIKTALSSSGFYAIDLDNYIQRILNGNVSEYEMDTMTNLRAFISVKHQVVNDTVNLPIQEKAGVQSYNSYMVGNTLHTNVNYDYQTVGYQPVQINRDTSCVYFGIRHHKEKVISYPQPHSVVEDTPFIHWSQICAYGNINDSTLLNDAITIYKQNNITVNSQKSYKCTYSGCSEIF